MIYAGTTVVVGLIFPRLEYHYLGAYRHGMTVSVAIAVFSSIASGMLALTGIVFSLAFVMVQFSSIAYSPRLVLWFGTRLSRMAWAYSPRRLSILSRRWAG